MTTTINHKTRTHHTHMSQLSYTIPVLVLREREASPSGAVHILENYCPCITPIIEAENSYTAVEKLQEFCPKILIVDLEADTNIYSMIIEHCKAKAIPILHITETPQPYRKGYSSIPSQYQAIDLLFAIENMRQTEYEEKLLRKIERQLIERFTAKEKMKICIPTNKGIQVVDFRDITHIEADRSYCTIFLENSEKIMISKTLKHMEALLPSNKFFRIHATHLVNKEYIKYYKKEDGGQVVLKNKVHLPLSRRRKQEFLKALAY